MKAVRIETLKVGTRFRVFPGDFSPILVRGRVLPRRYSGCSFFRYPGYFLTTPRNYLLFRRGDFVYPL